MPKQGMSKTLAPFLFLGFIFAAISDLNLIHLGGIGLITAITYITLKSRAGILSLAASAISDDYDEFDAELEDI